MLEFFFSITEKLNQVRPVLSGDNRTGFVVDCGGGGSNSCDDSCRGGGGNGGGGGIRFTSMPAEALSFESSSLCGS